VASGDDRRSAWLALHQLRLPLLLALALHRLAVARGGLWRTASVSWSGHFRRQALWVMVLHYLEPPTYWESGGGCDGEERRLAVIIGRDRRFRSP